MMDFGRTRAERIALILAFTVYCVLMGALLGSAITMYAVKGARPSEVTCNAA